MADQEIQGMLIQIEATTAQLRRELADADRLVARTTSGIERNLSAVDSAFDSTGVAAQRAGTLIRGAFAAMAGAGLVGGIIRQVDAYGQLADRMRMATASSAEYDLVQQHLLRTAQETYRPLAEAQELYIRTADVMRSLGFDTQQTLDITDSFSFLLVTNAAAADKADSALGAYTKSLQTGKVAADSWISIQTAMPTIVNAIASATGKGVEEIRRLGVEGKLSIDDINTGLLRTVEMNRKAAADMSTSVEDALVSIQNAVTAFVGRMEEQTGAVAGLADLLGVLADNIDLVAGVVGGVAVGALTLYSARAATATVETVRGIRAAVADRAARIAQADALLQVAIAEQRKAQTATLLAAREAEAARGTAVQTQMSIQLAQARHREAVATSAVVAAQAGLRTASAGLLTVLGGPMGLALLAGTAAASFLLLRDNADQAGISLEDLHKPVQQLREEFQKLNRDQREAALVKWADRQAEAADEVKSVYGELATSLRNALVSVSDVRTPAYGRQLQEYQALLDLLNEARAAGANLSPILREVGERLGVAPEKIDAWIKQAGAVSDADQQSSRIAETLRVLTGVTDENTASTNANNAAKAGMSSAGQTYLETLQKQLAGLQDNGDAIKIANRYIAEHTDLTETDKAAILSAASAIQAQKKANQAATASSKARTKSLQDELSALDAIIDRALPERKRLEDLEEGISGLRKAHALGKLSAEEMEHGIKNLNQAYGDGTLQQRIRDEQKLAEARRNSAEAYRAAMEVVLQARQDAINADVRGVGLGDDEREQMQRLDAVRQKYAEMRRELEQQQEDASRRLSTAAYEQRLADLADFQARELQMEVDGYEARLAAQADFRNGARRAWQNIKADAADVASATDDMLSAGFYSARDALVEFTETGKLKFRDFASSIIADMARIASQQAASSLLSGVVGLGISAVGSYFGGGAVTGSRISDYTSTDLSNFMPVASAKGNAFGRGQLIPFAKGGTFTNSIVSSPQVAPMALFGEAGPEAIVPLTRGADGALGIRAYGGGGGGGGTVVQVNAPVEVTVADRSDEGMQLDPQALQQNMQQQMRGIAERAVADSWRAGGISHRNSTGRA